VNVHAITTAALLAGVLVGCGDVKPKQYAEGTVTQMLHPEAQDVVRKEVQSHFGIPANLVVSMHFTDDEGEHVIDVGRVEGHVVSPGDTKLREHQMVAELTSDETLTAEDIRGLGLIWTGGDYMDAETVPQNDDERPTEVWFSVTDFQPTEAGRGLLSLNYKLQQPPAPGATFVLVGHRLRKGRQLYMQHCMHCHGYTGDGNGPTAKYLNPPPRDYRRGIFKFTSTGARAKVNRDDLKRIVKNGIPGTYMPSFLLLKDQELNDITEYIRWLALRGEYEHNVAVTLATDYSREAWERSENSAPEQYEQALNNWEQQGANPQTKPELEDFMPSGRLQQYVDGYFTEDVQQKLNQVTSAWVQSETPQVVVTPTIKRPPSTMESIRRGRALFLSRKAQCWECHGASAQGNGPQTVSYQPSQRPLAQDAKNPEPGLYDTWGNKIEPRDLTSGIYRGGRRPIDIYRRIHSGIKGTPMQAFGTSLKEEEIWDLVNYVLAVPHLENGTFEPEGSGDGAKATAGPARQKPPDRQVSAR